jgi:hypothetical protein
VDAFGGVCRARRGVGEGLAALEREPADIALGDIRTPGRDGLWLARS